MGHFVMPVRSAFTRRLVGLGFQLQKQASGVNPWSETVYDAHFARKEPQSGAKERAAVQQRISTPGFRANEVLRQRTGAFSRAWDTSKIALQLARSIRRNRPSPYAIPRADLA